MMLYESITQASLEENGSYLGLLKRKLKTYLLDIAKKNTLYLQHPLRKFSVFFFNCLRIFTKTEFFMSNLAVISYILYNNFFYTQLASVFDLQKDDNIDPFFFFFFKKILIPFTCFFSKLFFVFLDNI